MHLFDYDSGLSVLFRRIIDCLILGGLWLVCCIPVITVGAGSSAIYYTVEKHIIREEDNLFSCFFKSFRDNFKVATFSWLIILGIGLFLSWDLYFFWQMLKTGNPEGMLWVVCAALLLFLFITAVYVFSYVARFQDKARRALKNSLLLMLSHPLVNLKIVSIALIFVLIILTKPVFLLVFPGFACWMICKSMEKIFAKIGNTRES